MPSTVIRLSENAIRRIKAIEDDFARRLGFQPRHSPRATVEATLSAFITDRGIPDPVVEKS